MKTKITVDKKANAIYIYLGDSREKSVRTEKLNKEGTVLADFNDKGNIIGIEILNSEGIITEDIT